MKTIHGLMLLVILALLGSLVVVEKFADKAASTIVNELQQMKRIVFPLTVVFSEKSQLTNVDYPKFKEHATLAEMIIEKIDAMIAITYVGTVAGNYNNFFPMAQMLETSLMQITRFCAQMSQNPKLSAYDRNKMASYVKVYGDEAKRAANIKVLVMQALKDAQSASMSKPQTASIAKPEFRPTGRPVPVF